MGTGSPNNLNDVYQYHCEGEPLQKSSRDVFVKGSIKDVNDEFQVGPSRILVVYCFSAYKD